MSAFQKSSTSPINAALARRPLRIIFTLTQVLFALPVVSALLMSAAYGQSVAMPGTTTVSSEVGQEEMVVIDRGQAAFSVATNVPGISVKGKSDALHARVQIRRGPQGVTVDHVEAWLPVRTLATGIALRDEHMREHIFTTAATEVPDLRFEGGNASCAGVLAGREASCKVSGSLSIRGVPRDFSVTLRIHEAGSGPLLRASGDGLVRLSDYGIEAPSQFGVKTANEIQVHFEFPETAATAGTGGER